MTIQDHFLLEAKQENLIKSRFNIEPKYIIIHYTGGGSVSGAIRTLRRRGLSYHFIVDRQGEVHQGGALNRKAFHAGLSNWKGLENMNNHSIGISAANWGWLNKQVNGQYGRVDANNNPLTTFFDRDEVKLAPHFGGISRRGWELYPEKQVEKIKALCALLVKTYPTIKDVIGHDDISPGRKFDPGPAFPYEELYPLFPNRLQDKGELHQVVTKPNDPLSLRRGPGSRFGKIGSLDNGTKVYVRSYAYRRRDNRTQQSDWASVSLNDDLKHDGFVYSAYLEYIPE